MMSFMLQLPRSSSVIRRAHSLSPQQEGELATSHLIIVNPIAGRGKASRAVEYVKELLTEQKVPFDLAYTERPWHAAELARQAVQDGYRVVVAMGGDGTTNEVLNGLMAAQEAGEGGATLGVLCAGTGNDFAFGAGIPLDLNEGCTALARGHTKAIDVGYAEGYRYFGNGIGIGFDAVVNVQAARHTRIRGFAVYLLAVLKVLLLYYRAPITRVETDDRILEHPTLMVSVMNGRRMGGGFLTAPNASPHDGLFDICIGTRMSRLQMIALVPHFMRGTQLGHPHIITTRSRRVRVTIMEGTQVVHADGETIALEADHLNLELLPERLRVIC